MEMKKKQLSWLPNEEKSSSNSKEGINIVLCLSQGWSFDGAAVSKTIKKTFF